MHTTLGESAISVLTAMSNVGSRQANQTLRKEAEGRSAVRNLPRNSSPPAPWTESSTGNEAYERDNASALPDGSVPVTTEGTLNLRR
jgi:hypothetical protein